MTIRQRGLCSRTRGFTLVELAIVVAIVGVLAVLAIVGYRRYMLNAKVSEGQSMLGGIKVAQESHRAEVGIYAKIGTTNWCPENGGVGNRKVGWNPACNGGDAPWSLLPVHAENAVSFQYMTTGGGSGFTEPTDGDWGWVTWGTPDTTKPWYWATAKCDLDPGGDFTMLVGSSLDNRIFVHNAGE
ncbi:MAG: prepilin-type N-terminal cleavage/methylation domain-containing protein [Labilithrix sp.]|nr:prepilin-type N-terminal cleavage/methylation domain-containing protein [Labilithrix sp.]